MSLLIVLILSLSFIDGINGKSERYISRVKTTKSVKVMIIDGEVNTKIGRFARIAQYYKDMPGDVDKFDGHGSKVASALLFGDLRDKKELCPQVKIVACRTFFNERFNEGAYLECLRIAEVQNYDYVNISMQYGEYDKREYQAIKKITDKGARVVTAAGNSKLNYNEKPTYPAAYDADSTNPKVPFIGLNSNLIVVQALNENGNIANYSNVGDNAVSEYGIFSMYDDSGDVGYFSGTSFASPLFLHKLILDEVCGE